MQSRVNPYHYLIIIAIGALLFIPFLGAVPLFDWDEINFAESAREMIVTGDYTKVQINYTPFWEKPPLFIWLQVMSMKLFGVNEFAARFPNAIFGIITLCYIYYLGKKYFKGHLAHWWVLSYIGAITPHFYFKTGLIDPVFNFFIFCSIVQFFEAARNYHVSYNSNRHFLWAGIFTGIAILTKGPVALLVAVLVLFALVFAKRMLWFFKFKHLVIYGSTCLLVAAIWFLPESIKNGPWFLVEFINYQLGLFSQNIAGHQQPFYYHTLVLLFGCFPISIIALAGWKRNEFYTYPENLFRLTMICLFLVVLILFSIVKTKIVHYSSLCWLPLTFLSAYALESFHSNVFKFRWHYLLSLMFIGCLLSGLLIAGPVILANPGLKQQLINSITDGFSKGNLSTDAGWTYADALPGVLLLTAIVIFIITFIKGKTVKAFGVLLAGNALVVALAAVLLVPKVEKHSQHSAIVFFQSLAGKNCYTFNVGYKSYAPYFYAKNTPLSNRDSMYRVNMDYINSKNKSSYYQLNETERAELDDKQKNWLLFGNIDKPAYFIAKTGDIENLGDAKDLVKTGESGGFVMFRRLPVQH